MANSNKREKTIIKTSFISILANLILVGLKAFIGFMANSIAIISDAINNLSDVLSSIITIIGTKLANKAPDKKHPYGYGRIEYITSLVVSAIVLYAGFTALIESIKKIINPEIPDYTTTTLVILIVGIIVKFILGLYVKKVGKKVRSDSLVASGIDAFNDAILSISVLASTIIYMLFHISLEAYVGVLVSLYIIKAGIELIKKSVSSVLGTHIESKLTKSIKKEILKETEVQGAFDLILNDYGPGKYLGSIHIEVPDTLSVADIDKISRRITKNVIVKKKIHDIVFSHKGVLEMHGFYMDKTDKTLSLDIIIDFAVLNREELYKHIYDDIKTEYPDYNLNITLDIDAND